MTEYKKLQIIKHALQHYTKRADASEKEILEETRLLNEITLRVEYLQEKYGIRRNERA